MYNLDEMLDRSVDTWSNILNWDMEAVSPWAGATAFVEAKPTESWETGTDSETWTETESETESTEAPTTVTETVATAAGFETLTEMTEAAAEGCPFASKMINDAEGA
ncbi:MAG: hypothetical protein MK073_05230 [Phycisphaerales bacterium]|nr:hypothetical protein [Phycisphaerales bacterium]